MNETISIARKIYDITDNQVYDFPFVGDFLKEWTNAETYVMGHTSGSTGMPKPLRLDKNAMRASATRTNKFFDLGKGDDVLLCLNTDYIAGKMIVVRAIMGGMNIVAIKPASAPMWNCPVKFAAMVPMQVETLLQTEEGKDRLKKIGILIIGGSPLGESTRKELKNLNGPVCYTTYGMTETLSHIAVANIMGDNRELIYNTLPDIQISTDSRSCLVIKATYIQEEPFVTNDVVELTSETSFKWRGRWDHVVNSGGIKLFPEEIEKKIAPLISQRFYLTAIPDDVLGQKMILKIEGEEWEKEKQDKLIAGIKAVTNRYECPRQILFMDRFAETSSGKVKRL